MSYSISSPSVVKVGKNNWILKKSHSNGRGSIFWDSAFTISARVSKFSWDFNNVVSSAKSESSSDECNGKSLI